MRVLMISKALVVGAYQRKAEELAGLPDIELTVAVPPYWREGRRRQALERAYTAGYHLVVLPMVFNGHYHVHFYRRLAALIEMARPDVIHIDEEQYNLATAQAMRLAVRYRMPALFFTWQNIDRRYPPPFSLFERYTFRHAAHAIAGSDDAAGVIRAKGYAGPVTVIPQFGIDPDLFAPSGGEAGETFVVGFVGRLVSAKGLHVLLDALARLDGAWELRVVGTGEAEADATRQAARLGIADRVLFMGQRPSTAMPETLRGCDVVVGPSLTTASWKEQFGRVFVEAMACGVPVIGSDSGEIPAVIGDAGIVVPEGNPVALADAIRRLRDDPAERDRLAAVGRRRVLSLYTQRAVAERTYGVYRQMLAGSP